MWLCGRLLDGFGWLWLILVSQDDRIGHNDTFRYLALPFASKTQGIAAKGSAKRGPFLLPFSRNA